MTLNLATEVARHCDVVVLGDPARVTGRPQRPLQSAGSRTDGPYAPLDLRSTPSGSPDTTSLPLGANDRLRSGPAAEFARREANCH